MPTPARRGLWCSVQVADPSLYKLKEWGQRNTIAGNEPTTICLTLCTYTTASSNSGQGQRWCVLLLRSGSNRTAILLKVIACSSYCSHDLQLCHSMRDSPRTTCTDSAAGHRRTIRVAIMYPSSNKRHAEAHSTHGIYALKIHDTMFNSSSHPAHIVRQEGR